MNQNRIKYRPGDVFAVPICESVFGLGHIVECTKYQATCALFAARGTTASEVAAQMTDSRKPISIMVVGNEYLETGRWPILANRQADYSDFKVPTHSKSTSYGQGWAEMFLAAYHGFDPWDGFDSQKHPRHNQDLLIPGVPLPPTVRYKRDLTTAELIAFYKRHAPAPVAAPPPVTDGPALVTIQLVYPGTGMPSTDLVRRRQDFERRIEAAGAGEVDGAETGAGVMEIFLRAGDVRRAVALVEKIAEETGWKDDMLVETAPLSDEDEDEDEESEDSE